MPIRIVDLGQGNQFEATPEFRSAQNGTVRFDGDNNHVVIGQHATTGDVFIRCGSNATVHVGDCVNLAQVKIYMLTSAKLIIGEFSSFVGAATISAHERADITLGHGCLIADEVSFSVSDMHSVIDLRSGQRTNTAKPIRVGHRVWFGARSTILKGAEIGDGSIVGAHSLVNNKFPENVLLGGIPARVLRTEVSWRFELD